MENFNLLLTMSSILGVSIVLATGIFFGWLIRKDEKMFLAEIDALSSKISPYTLNKKLSKVEMKEIEILFGESKIFQATWSEFSETLVLDESSNSYYNTINLSNFINVSAFIEKTGSFSFHKKSPGLVTSVGLCLSFFFIIMGLGQLTFSSPDALQTSIQSLVTNLGGKFLSSVFGILSAVLLTVYEHSSYSKCKKKLEEFIDQIDKMLIRRPQEVYLLQVKETINQCFSQLFEVLGAHVGSIVEAVNKVEEKNDILNANMAQFGTDLANQLKNSFEKDVSQPLQIALQIMQQEKSQSQTEMLKDAIQQFKTMLSENAGSEFSKLGVTVSDMSQVLKGSVTQTTEAISQVERLLTDMTNHSEKANKANSDQMQTMQNSLLGLADQLNVKLNNLAQESTSTFSKQNDVITQKIAGLSAVLGQIAEAGSKITEQFNYSNKQIISQTSGLTTAVSNSSLEFIAKQKEFTLVIADLRVALTDILGKYKDTIASQDRIIGSQGQVIQGQLNLQDKMHDAQIAVVQTLEHVSAKDHDFRKMQESNERALTNYRMVFAEIETGLSRIISQLSSNVEVYNQATSVGLSTTLDLYGKALSDSVGDIRGSIEGLREVIEDLEDALSKVVKKAG